MGDEVEGIEHDVGSAITKRIHALLGDIEKALAAMRSTIDGGLRWEWNFLPHALSLQSLWDVAEFKAMLAELGADMAIRREGVRAELGTLHPPDTSR